MVAAGFLSGCGGAAFADGVGSGSDGQRTGSECGSRRNAVAEFAGAEADEEAGKSAAEGAAMVADAGGELSGFILKEFSACI